jgi:DNA-binding GntR family transcriptional regulator
MSVLPLRRSTAAGTLADALREELLSGVFAPGTPLPEAEVVQRTGAAAATVREALAELARDGLVVHSLHRGVEVARITPRTTARSWRPTWRSTWRSWRRPARAASRAPRRAG